MSAPVPRMTGTALSRNPRIPGSVGNPTSYLQAGGRNNTSLVLPDWKPWPDLSPDGRGPVPETLGN